MANAANPSAIAVVVVNWNSWRLTLDCLAALRRSVGASWCLFIVDNCSTDGSTERLSGLGDDVVLLQSPINGGWTGGNNLGVKAALEAQYEWLFILNSDAQVLPDTLSRLLSVAQNADTPPVVGPIHLLPDGETLDFIGATVDPASGMPEITTGKDKNRAALSGHWTTPFIKGAAIFVSRLHFDQVGFFDDRYYLNYDDTDWGYRARRAGFSVIMTAEAAILHIGSATIGGAVAPLNLYFVARNSLLFASEHCRPGQRVRHVASLFHKATWLSQHRSRAKRLMELIFGKRPEIVAWRRGVTDFVAGRFGDCPEFIRHLRRTI